MPNQFIQICKRGRGEQPCETSGVVEKANLRVFRYMRHAHRKKLFYIPGTISLLLLPFAFLFFAKEWVVRSYQRVVTIYALRPEDKLPDRNYTEIALTGDKLTDIVKLEYAQIRIREIIQAGDTTNGVHFVYRNKATYGVFADAINILLEEDAKTYAVHDSDIWFFQIQLPPTITGKLPGTYFVCGNVLPNYYVHEPDWWTQTKQNLRIIWASSWQLIIAFCIFVMVLLIKTVLGWRLRTGR